MKLLKKSIMDPTQRDITNKNLVALLETTKLSTTFLAVFEEKNILADADLDQINAKKYEGQQAKVKAFYDIILTRIGAFDVLKYALEKTKQNGALQLLTQEQAQKPFKSLRHQKFLGLPDYIRTFLDGAENLLILCTTDCSLSTQRLQENIVSSIFDDVKTFLSDVPKLLAMDRSEKAIFILNSGSETQRVLHAAKRLSHKTILVTKCNFDGAVQDNFTWNCLSPIQQDIIRDQINCIQSDLQITEQALEKLEHETLVDFLNNKPLQLFTDNIPPELPYYVSRRFVTRCVLTDELFRTNGKPDIFVFVDIEKWKLAEYCDANPMSTSPLFLNNNDPCCRYLLLEDDNDFDKLVQKVDVPVHLIRYENNKFRWLRSERSVQVVQNIIAAQEQQDILREEEFIEFIDTTSKLRQPICIADIPGMGKSVLLARMGKLLNENTKRLVCFVIIGELIKIVNEQICDGKNVNIQIIIEKYLVDTFCNNVVANHVLKAKLKSETLEIELLLDGYDEIDSSNFRSACKVLTTLLGSYQSIRLWVTTRPHLLEPLENTLNVLGHNIQELDSDDQVYFLTKYWSQANTYQHDKLSLFAQKCLSCLKANMNSEDKIIAGIPLQCLLIAEVYEDKAGFYCNKSESGEPNIDMTGSIVKFYELFIEKKITTFRSRYNKEPASEGDIFNAHIHYSFFVIFPENDISKVGNNLTTVSVDMEQILDVGILESSSTRELPRFIHRTFAEYFIALHFANVLKNPQGPSAETYLFKSIFQTKLCSVKVNQITIRGTEFQYAVICHFVDKLISRAISKINIEQLTKGILKQVVTASVYHNLPNLFQYFRRIFSSKQTINSFVFSRKLVLLCFNKSDLPLIQTVSHCYEASCSSQIKNLAIEVKKSYITPIHVAVKRGSFEIVNYLIVNNMVILNTHQHDDILDICVIESLNEAHSIIQDKIQILSRILGIYEDTIGWSFSTNELPIFAKSVHVKLLIALLKIKKFKLYYNAVILVKLLLQNIKSLPPNSFEELLRFVYNFFAKDYNSLYTIFISPILKGRTTKGSLLYAIFEHSEPAEGTLNLLKEVYFGVLRDPFQELIKRENYHLIIIVLLHERMTKYLAWLIEMGCSLKSWKASFDTPLSYAVTCGNLEAVNYILKHSLIPINMANKFGKTALHTIAELWENEKQLEIIKTLLNSGADVLAKDTTGKNLLARMLPLTQLVECPRLYEVLEIILPLYPKSQVNCFKSELLKQENFTKSGGPHAHLVKLCLTIMSESTS